MKRFSALLGAFMLVASHAFAGPTPSYPQATIPLSGSETTTILQGTPPNAKTVQVSTSQLAVFANRAAPLSLWNFMTPACQADAVARTELCDDTSAVQAWIAATIAQVRNGYAPDGTYKIAVGQIVVDLATVPSNGITYFGDSTSTVVFDMRSNAANPPFLFHVSGGTPSVAAGETYGSVLGISFQCNVAGPCTEFGNPDLSDAINQARINISVQNFNTSSSSTCGRFNFFLSATVYANCSTAATPSGGNAGWEFDQAQFNYLHLGTSNAGYAIHLTNGVNTGNDFDAMDCEVVAVCLKIDSSGSVANAWNEGIWAYSVSGVVETAGGDNHAFVPGINADPTNFIASGSEQYFEKWDNTTLATRISPTFVGPAAIINTTGADAMLGLESGSLNAQAIEDSSGNFTLQNLVSGQGIFYVQAGAGNQEWKINGSDLMDLGLSGLQVKAPFAAFYSRSTLTTVAGLTTIDPTPQAGDVAAVSDAAACTVNTTVTGGGSTACGVLYSGAAWKAVVTH